MLALVALGLFWPGAARAVPIGGNHSGEGIPAGIPPEVIDVGVSEHLNEQLPLDVKVHDHTGREVTLGSFFNGTSETKAKKPVVFFFAYYSCPVVCSLILDDAMKSLNDVSWSLGRDYDMVVVSINPREKTDRAAAKRQALLNSYVRGGAEDGLHILTADQATIDRLTKAAGFQYHYDADQDQFAHPSLMMITTPDGHLARYLYGLEFPPNDVKLGLFEASEGRSINTVEQLILYCYHYDPKAGKYVLLASRVMQVGAGATAIILGGALLMFWLRERRKGGLLAKAEIFTKPASEDADTTDSKATLSISSSAVVADGEPLPVGTGR
jgi:protein SCO1/2